MGDANHTFRIHSIEARDEIPMSNGSDNQRYIDSESTLNPGLDKHGMIANKTIGEAVSCDEGVPETQLNTPTNGSSANTYETLGVLTATSSTQQDEDTSYQGRTRSSKRKHQSASPFNSRERIVRHRYPDLDKLKMQAENNCPDLENPFWENIETFSCKRSVFYRNRTGIICHLSYFKEVHEPMGFKIDSKHVMIKSSKTPKCPLA
ncbi:hypothetical protein QAD02_014283 [Eretmocerus hayati]|uniref:Uncharacterized protein n=1 Tax=Eretmocerus hayati TaxID=131215 RepID=A0ACC2P650_9HYME|nr:hypothetical protein QAD02_014283 [Eretmocerus hayati]